uniref:Uncharacterized protein n=1 Tax=Oryza punctata TaxID=4537 RepID=A0A0E0JRF7_ORYPU
MVGNSMLQQSQHEQIRRGGGEIVRSLTAASRRAPSLFLPQGGRRSMRGGGDRRELSPTASFDPQWDGEEENIKEKGGEKKRM